MLRNVDLGYYEPRFKYSITYFYQILEALAISCKNKCTFGRAQFTQQSLSLLLVVWRQNWKRKKNQFLRQVLKYVSSSICNKQQQQGHTLFVSHTAQIILLDVLLRLEFRNHKSISPFFMSSFCTCLFMPLFLM